MQKRSSKRFLSLLLTLMMLMSLALPASATDSDPGHEENYATHTKASFYTAEDEGVDPTHTKGACNAVADCRYTLTQYQEDCGETTEGHDWSDKDGVCKNCGFECTVNHDEIYTTRTCKTCGVVGTKNTNDCDDVDGHATILTTGKCDTCGAAGTHDVAAWGSHTKESFDADGACKVADCTYGLSSFQTSCTNSADHPTTADDEACETCGYTVTAVTPPPETKHEADETQWKADNTNHWRPCTATGCTEEDHKYQVATHTVSDWNTTKEATANEAGEKTGTCSMCNENVTEVIPATGVTDPDEHQHKVAQDAEWKSDENGHWHECTESDCPGKDDPAKWPDYAVHALGEDGVCTECNYDSNGGSGDTHDHDNWADDWSMDADNHWKECQEEDCDEQKDSAAHTLGDDNVCTVCHWHVAANCPDKADHNSEWTCPICEATGTYEHDADFASHTKDGFAANGSCEKKLTNGENCTYDLDQFQADCGKDENDGHDWSNEDGVCKTCGFECAVDHTEIYTTRTCETCGAAGTKSTDTCPDKDGHATILTTGTCDTCGAAGTHDATAWGSHTKESFYTAADEEADSTHVEGACKVTGCTYTLATFQTNCTSKGDHETILKGETCATCGYVGTYVAPVDATVGDVTLEDGGTANIDGEAVSDAIGAAKSEDVDPEAPVNVIIDVEADAKGANGAELTLSKEAVAALVAASTEEDEDGENIDVPVTVTVKTNVGTVVLPLKALTDAQDTEEDSVTISVASVANDDLDLPTTTNDDGEEVPVVKDDGGNVLDIDLTTADIIDVSVLKNDGTDAGIAGLTDTIQVTIKVDAEKAVDLYYVVQADGKDVLKFIGYMPVVDGAITFEVNHLTTFVAVTHVHTAADDAEWKYNATGHWHECSDPDCTETDVTKLPDYAVHVDEDDDGEGDGICDVCGWHAEADCPNKATLKVDETCDICGAAGEAKYAAADCPDRANHDSIAEGESCPKCDYVGQAAGNDDPPAHTQETCPDKASHTSGWICPICGATGTKPSSSGGSSSGGGGGGSSTKPGNTVTNPDGSTTTTTTDKKTGAVTETTKQTDGTTTVTVTKKDGSSVATTTKKDGTVATVTTSAAGNVTAEVKLPTAVVNNAAGKPIVLPMQNVPVTSNAANAAAITVNTGGAAKAKVTIPTNYTNPGTVAVMVKPDGSTEAIMTSVPTDGGITVTVPNGTTVKVIDNTRTYADVSYGAWYQDAVTFVSARGLFAGTASDSFSPNLPMNRAMMMTVLARLAGADVSGGATWYEKGMQWAVANGVSDGSNPNGNISREQLVTMIWRYRGSPAADASLSNYTDAGNISSYANTAMAWAVQNGLVSGYGDGRLGPQDQATRAQVSQIFKNLLTSFDLAQ